MNIPLLPHEKPIDENGQWTASWLLWFQQLVTVLQKTVSNQGLRVPSLPTEIIKQLNISSNTSVIVYDSDTKQFKGNADGTFKVFPLT